LSTLMHGRDGALPLAWALKDLCYASWSSDPPRAVRAAQALQRLREAVAAPSMPQRQEIDAIADWTGAFACLIQGDMEGALTRLDAAASAFAALAQPIHAAHTQVPKIMALSMLGRHDAAIACADAAQRLMLAHGDTVGASKVLQNLGALHLRSDRYADAASCFREAAVLFAKQRDHERSVMADIGLADALAALGEPNEAAIMYARARMRAAAHGFPVLEAMADESLALLQLARGQYRDALAGLESARRGYEALQMPQHLAIVEKQLADAYLELRLLPEALAGFDAATRRFSVLGMQDDLAWTLVQQGRALALSGRAVAAQAALTSAAGLFAAQGYTVGVAAVALARAELALSRADAARALALAAEAAQAFQAAGIVERGLRADGVRAQALLALRQTTAARECFDQTLEAARRHRLLPLQLRCLTGRALTTTDPAAARADLEEAVLLFEDQRRTLPGDEVRSAFQADHLAPFVELLRLELERHDTQPDADGTALLLQLDRFRARSLGDRLTRGEADGGGGRAGHAATADLRARLLWLYRRLQRLQEEAATSSGLTAQLREAERELLERVRRARLAEAGSAEASADSAELDIAALRALLRSGDAMVEYGVAGDELFACIVTPQGVHVQRRVASWHEVQRALHSLRLQLDTMRHGRQRLQRHLPLLAQRTLSGLQRLHQLVWQPFAARLRSSNRVLIVAHGALSGLPMAALHDGRCSLAEQHELAYAPSARLAQRGLAWQPTALRRVLALGESSRLPHAAREAQAIADLWPEGRALIGAEATSTALGQQACPPDVIHLACHAQFRTDNPAFSSLLLDDGPLFAESIELLRLPGAVVVLSGCETALHDGAASDEAFGLTRAFLVAGAARVMASLWAVDDATTEQLMADFHAGLRTGLNPAAALRRAQLALRARHEHPFYWAAFTLTGGW
jgi:CHAT domain-containing protein